MGEVLEALTALLLLPVVALAGGASLVLYLLRRNNRLWPGRSAPVAPLRWLWSPGTAATLHRRLRGACKLVSLVPGAGSGAPGIGTSRRRRPLGRSPAVATDGIAQLAQAVVSEALQLDRQVVSASWLARGVPRAQAMAHLDYQVGAIEEAARRVHQLADRRATLSRPTVPGSLSLEERISAMESAVSELTPRPPVM